MAWEKVKLGDIATCIQPGPFGSQLHNSDYSESGTPIIMPKDMIDGKISHSNLIFVGEEHTKRLCRHQVHAGNLMVARKGDVRKCVFITENEDGWMTGSDCLKVALKESYCYPRFIYYQLRSPFIGRWLEKISIGATMPSINTSLLSSIELVLPSLKEQKRIADILSAYDNLIENNQKQIKLLEEAAQRLYKQWFIDLRYPGHETTPIVDGLPKGWRNVTLGEVLSKITTGLNPRKNFVLGQGNNYYVTIKNMGDNRIYLDDKCDRVDNVALEKINKRSDLKTGDILFSGIGTIGRVYLIDIPTNNWNVSESVFTMRVNERVSKEFLYLMLLSDDVQSYCDLHAHGVAQRGIRMADLKEYKFVLPENKIIDSFTTMVEPIIEKTQFLRKSINHAAESRDRLLPKLMNGEIEV